MNILKISIAIALLASISVSESFAQRRNTNNRRRPASRTTTTTNRTTANVPTVAVPAPDFTSVEAPLLDSSGYNTLSVHPIHSSDIMYQMTIWRKMDMKEKANTPWLAESIQLSKFIVEAVRRGELKAYLNDSLTKEMSSDYFESKMEDKEATQMNRSMNGNAPRTLLKPQNLHLLEIKENVIFDKQRSRTFYDIQTISLILPAKFSGDKGAEMYIASFKYKDLVKILDKNTNAKWYNISNKAEDKRMSDAFELRLFSSRIVKVANPQNQEIEEQVYGNPKISLITSKEADYKMVAAENELWDY